MYVRRISEIRHSGIHPQSFATRNMIANKLKDVTAADNFSNLLEAPILFYVICLILFVVDGVTQTQLFLAWTYVALRAVHSLIHVTYNKVMHRWLAYVTSTLCLFVMWTLFAAALYARHAA